MKPAQTFLRALLFVLSQLAHGIDSKQENGLTILQEGAKSSLNGTGVPPYQLRAHFTFIMSSSETVAGSYKLTWMARDRWRREIDVGNFQELAVGGKNKKWIRRSLDVQPLLVHRLNTAVEFLQDLRVDPTEQVIKISEPKRDGMKLQCVSYKRTVGLERMVCFDTGTGALASVRDGLWEFQYSEPQRLGSKLIPSRIRLTDEDRLRVEVQIDKIGEPSSIEDALFTPPSSAQEWVDCEKPVTGKLVSKAAPKYPEQARQAHHEGSVIFYNVISTDGSLDDLRIIQSAGRYFDQAAMDAVKQWKYAPTTCDGIPIRVENEIQVNFALSRF